MKEERFELLLQVYEDPAECPAALRELMDQARGALKNAYAPYSGFPVGAALRLANGLVITGTNQENASFPLGLCAERVALFRAATAHPDEAPVALAVTAGRLDSGWLAPCGGCRQVMVETEQRFGQPFDLILTRSDGALAVIRPASAMMPLAFDGHLLGRS
jgi:cytidine deaminase